MRNLKFALVAIIASTMFIACGSNRNLPPIHAQAVEVYVPFSGRAYQTNDTHWRASGDGSSTELAMARRIAMQNARTMLAGSIQATVRAVTEQYADQRQVQDAVLFQTRIQEISRTVIDQQLNDVRTIGERTFRQPDGRITVHVALEMNRDAVRNALSSRISADEVLQLDFDQYQFRRIFEEEMRVIQRR